jgi:hypothetical protein
VAHPRRAGAPDTATTAGGRASAGVCASRSGGRDGVVFSLVRPVRAAVANTRARRSHHDDAGSFDKSRDNWADGISAILSDPVSLAHGVPDSLTGAIEARYTDCSSTRARSARLIAFAGSGT